MGKINYQGIGGKSNSSRKGLPVWREGKVLPFSSCGSENEDQSMKNTALLRT